MKAAYYVFIVSCLLILAGCSGSKEAGDNAKETAAKEALESEWGRRPGKSYATPFKDPTKLSQARPKSFDVPYSNEDLKNGRPLIILAADSAAYSDPGMPPISGDVYTNPSGDMVRLPDGAFIMGFTDEDPFDLQNSGRKRVSVMSFYIDRFEVTNAQYRAFLDELQGAKRLDMTPDSSAWHAAASRTTWTTYFNSDRFAQHPVVAVTWKQARAYCAAQDKRLPTEAEWEFASRAGRVGGIYPWDGFYAQDNYGRFLANYHPGRLGEAADGYSFTAPVGSYPPSRWGLHDMAGNVAEWVEDAYTPRYSVLANFDPVYRNRSESRHVVRGGSWGSNEMSIGVGYRDFQEMEEPSTQIGFRCAADVHKVERNAAAQQAAPDNSR